MVGDERASQHFDQFELRVDELRRVGGEEAIWKAILNVARQVSLVRHDVVTVHQQQETRDLRLFGDKEMQIPGKFDMLEGGIQEVKDLVNRAAAEQAQTTIEEARQLKAQTDARRRWWESWWTRLGVTAGVTLALLDLLHSLGIVR